MNAAVVDVRRAAKILVEREEIRSQSRMLAYERVGQMIGASGMWVRRFVKGYEGFGLNHAVALNILGIYDSICSRVENNNEQLRRDISHAAHQSTVHQHQASTETDFNTARLLPPNEP